MIIYDLNKLPKLFVFAVYKDVLKHKSQIHLEHRKKYTAIYLGWTGRP